MKKILFAGIALSFLTAVAGFSQEWGGSINNVFTLTAKQTGSVSDFAKTGLWLNTPLGEFSTFNAAINYTLQTSTSADERETFPSFPYTFNIDLLKINRRIDNPTDRINALTLNFGRFPVNDVTRYVLNHNIDGLGFVFSYPRATFSFTAGYTGFIWRYSSGVSISINDQIAASDTSEIFGSQRMIGVLKLVYPNLFKQRLGLSFVFQEDFRDLSEDEPYVEVGETELQPGQGGPLDTQYVSADIRGLIRNKLIYDYFLSFGFGSSISYKPDDTSPTGSSYQRSPILSFLTGFNVNYFMPEFYYSVFGLRFILSSGDEDSTSLVEGNQDDRATAFTPINASGLGVVFSPTLGNISLVELTYSLRPFTGSDNFLLTNLQGIVKTALFFRPTTGPISDTTVTGDDSAYLGFEIDLIGNIRIFSDFGISFTLGSFIPSDQFSDNSLQFKGLLIATVSF